MVFKDPFFETMNFVFDNDEVTFDDIGFGLGPIGGAGRPPDIQNWIPPYGVSR